MSTRIFAVAALAAVVSAPAFAAAPGSLSTRLASEVIIPPSATPAAFHAKPQEFIIPPLMKRAKTNEFIIPPLAKPTKKVKAEFIIPPLTKAR